MTIIDDLPSPSPAPVGVFDSGVGGLSVWREVARQLPNQNTIYLADQIHVPYGPRSSGQVLQFSHAIVRFLLGRGCKLIVIACNTASAVALHEMRRQFPAVPFVGMEPAVKPAAERSRAHKVGVLATPATFQGELFNSVVERFASGVRLVNQICPGLVEQVETGQLDTPDTLMLLQLYLGPMLQVGVDTIVLACTHYPFLLPAIQRIVGPDIDIIDPSPAIARQVQRIVTQHALAAPAQQSDQHTFYTTGDPAAFSKLLGQLTGLASCAVRPAVWNDAASTLSAA